MNSGREILIIPLLALFLVGWGDPTRDASVKGVEAYRAGDYEKALSWFIEAEKERPDVSGFRFNSASALYQLERFEEAASEYAGAAGEPELAARALYGAGNSLARMGKLEEAIELYKQSLVADPADEDVRHNLEMARKMLEQQEQQEDEQSDEQSDEQNEDEQEEQQQQQDEQSDEQNEDDQEQQNEDQQEEGEDEQEQEQQEGEGEEEPPPGEAPPPDGSMSEEDAQRILEALAEEEESQRQASLEKRKAKQKKLGKDW